MAVNYKGEPITTETAFTTTGLMNRKPAKLKPLKMGNIKQPKPKVVQKNLPEERVPHSN